MQAKLPRKLLGHLTAGERFEAKWLVGKKEKKRKSTNLVHISNHLLAKYSMLNCQAVASAQELQIHRELHIFSNKQYSASTAGEPTSMTFCKSSQDEKNGVACVYFRPRTENTMDFDTK